MSPEDERIFVTTSKLLSLMRCATQKLCWLYWTISKLGTWFHFTEWKWSRVDCQKHVAELRYYCTDTCVWICLLCKFKPTKISIFDIKFLVFIRSICELVILATQFYSVVKESASFVYSQTNTSFIYNRFFLLLSQYYLIMFLLLFKYLILQQVSWNLYIFPAG